MYLKKFLMQVKENRDLIIEKGVVVGSDLLFDGVTGQIAPGIIAIRSAYKQKQMESRISKALDLMDNRIEAISKKLANLDNEDYRFVEEVVFPSIFENIIEEDEEEKIIYIINSFETVIEDKIIDQELVFSYLDVLRALRIIDIQHLYRQTAEYRKELSSGRRILEIDQSEIGQRKSSLTRYIHNKLERLGLIETDVPVIPEEGPVTKFGYDFINFIKVKGKAYI